MTIDTCPPVIVSDLGAARPFVERRRPGRIDDVSPHLIPLLRGEVVPLEPIEPDLSRRTERTITIVMSVTALFWAAVLLGGWAWLNEVPSEAQHPLPPLPSRGLQQLTKTFTAEPY